jgi:hypothetical protein
MRHSLGASTPRARKTVLTLARVVGQIVETLTRCYSVCIMVEAAGVEPASENVTGQETTCLFAFMPWALPQDVRDARSERTRNGQR